jgi:predicted AAA+ superfamily ATPase
MDRYYSDLLARYLSFFPCVVVVGPRQCGKTTFVKQLSSPWTFYDLEKESDFQIISKSPDIFFRLNPDHVVIDEAQIFPDLFKALRVAIDADRNKKGRFIITGSSSPLLEHGISESLAGRVGIIELAPFSCCEAFGLSSSPFFDWLNAPSPLKDLYSALTPSITISNVHDFWLKGGYPEPWVMKSEPFSRDWYSSYIQTYLFRDIGALFPRINRERFRFFINLLLASSGTVINYLEISRSLGLSAPVVKDYFEIAHNTFIWRTIPAFSKKSAHRLIRHPKGFIRDSGLLHRLQHVTSQNALLAHPKMGASWEGMIIEEVLRGLCSKGIDHEYSFYRSNGGAEVDLVLEGDFGSIAIEIKHGSEFGIRQLAGISSFIDEQKCRCGFVITTNDKPQWFSEKLLGIPITWLFSKRNKKSGHRYEGKI